MSVLKSLKHKKDSDPVEIDTKECSKKLEAELKRIDYDKWIKGEELKCDPGSDFIMQWIADFGADFHEEFIISDCRTCANCSKCGGKVKFECLKYEPALSSQSRHLLKKLIALIELRGISEESLTKIKKHYGISYNKKK